MKEINFNEQPFRVIRVVPTVPVDRYEDVIAHVDLIHLDYKLMFLDCPLLTPPDPYVRIADDRLMLQYLLHGCALEELDGNINKLFYGVDFDTVIGQTEVALNHFFGLPDTPEAFVEWALNNPLAGCGWRDWCRDQILEDPEWNEHFIAMFRAGESWQSWLLNEFLECPAWEGWVDAHQIIPDLPDAFAQFLRTNPEVCRAAEISVH
jgi:hypothetical protein